ncbi:PPR repeat family [Nakaseomyces glabratus]
MSMIAVKVSRVTVRFYHGSLVNFGNTNLKEKLHVLKKKSTVIRKSSKELQRLAEKQKIKRNKAQKASYHKDRAVHILKSKYGISDISRDQLGPTSENDIKFLSKIKDNRLLYTILGVNGFQLRDAILVTKDVEKFLKRGQVEKAVMLVKLAKAKGSSGANLIMDYYLNELHSPKSAVDMYNWRKKNGIPINEYTDVTLFDGLAKQPEPISTKYGEMVLKILDSKGDDEEFNIREFNAALGALTNCTDYSLAFQLFDSRSQRYSRKFDAITFTTMIKACNKIKDEDLLISMLNEIIAKMTYRSIDPMLVNQLVSALSGSDRSKRLNREALLLASEVFTLDLGIPDSGVERRIHYDVIKESMRSRGDGLRQDKLYPSIIQACNYSDLPQIGIKFFAKITGFPYENETGGEQALLEGPQLTYQLFKNYIDLLVRHRTSVCGSRSMDLFETINSTPSLKQLPMKVLLRHVYTAVQRQGNKQSVYCDATRANALLQRVNEFVKHVEPTKDNVVPLAAWKFVLPIAEKLQQGSQLSEEPQVHLTQSFLSTISALRLPLNKEAKSTLLAGIRVINSLGEQLRLPPTVDLEDIPLELRDKFLYRRLLLRVKTRLVHIVDSIDKNTPQLPDDLSQLISQLGLHKR